MKAELLGVVILDDGKSKRRIFKTGDPQDVFKLFTALLELNEDKLTATVMTKEEIESA